MSTPQEEFKIGDAASYDTVADRFHFWTERVTQPIAQRLVEIARVRPGQRMLDVGTGSGVVALVLGKRIAPDGRITGIDISDGMLDTARANASAAGLDRLIEFRNMDAEVLQFEDSSFDAALSLFAILHLPDPERAVREMLRVVKPGGRVVIGIGGGLSLSFAGIPYALQRLSELWRQAQGRVLVAPRMLDALIEKHLPHSVEHEKPRSRAHVNLARLFGRVGFVSVKTEFRGLTHTIPSPEDFWEVQATFSSVARKRLSAASAADIKRVRAEFFARSRRVLGLGGTLIYRNGAMIVSGTRPLS